VVCRVLKSPRACFEKGEGVEAPHQSIGIALMSGCRTGLVFPLAFAFVFAPQAGAQPNCRKGIPCGNSCIAANKVCRIGPGSARDAAPNVSPDGAAQPLGFASVSALADRSNPRLPWVVRASGGPYYRNGCAGAARVPPAQRLYFRTEDEVRRIGFAAATDRENACDAKARAWHQASVDSARASQVLSPRVPTEVPPDSAWVGSVADGVYFRRSCATAQDLAPSNRKYFRSEAAAVAEGYRRSRTSGC
jgi:hypothetical protein